MATSQGLYGKYRVFNSGTGEEIKKVTDLQSLNDGPLNIKFPFVTLHSNDLKWLISTIKKQQKAIETLKNLVAKETERRVEDNKEWFDAQSVLVEKNARLRKHIRKAIVHFNQDEHPEGMSQLLKALEEEKK